MRAYALVAALVLAAVMVSGMVDAMLLQDRQRPYVTKDFVGRINARTGGKWKASTKNGPMIHGATLEQIRSLMGVKNHDTSILSKRVFTAEELAEELPESFDSAERWPNCPTITQIRDQSECGSCWAIAAAGAMSDRHCTYGGIQDVEISTADLMSCCTSCGDGCDGGWPAKAWEYYVQRGLVSEYCQPYPFGKCAHHTDSDKYPPCKGSNPTPKCNATCTDEEIPVVRYNGAVAMRVSGEEEYKHELMTNGPFEVSFTVYEDFLAYKSGIYTRTSDNDLGGHAVRLVGWGVDNGTPYWKIANSWNEEWGENGFFRILRGTNECGIEESGTAGLPQIPKNC